MNPSRRKILKLLLSGVGASLSAAPLTAFTASATGMTYYREDEAALVTRVCDLIIPETETPGAVSAGVPRYLDALFADWADAHTQLAEHQFLAALSERLAENGLAFARLSDARAYTQLTRFDTEAYATRPGSSVLADSYRTFKERLTQAYFISEKGALLELEWLATPGEWIASLPLEETES